MQPFPSLLISANELEPQGAFAEAQALYLTPDPRSVAELTEALEAKNIGVVAHFYMDPELQGVLSASSWPHIHISDSLVMADRALAMARSGIDAVVVLGVDFMSENVRAMLDAAGFEHVPVYRAAAETIGCSLAESAEQPAYEAYLEQAARQPTSLHVIYINTSLRTKAIAQSLVPTITCTSSNVMSTLLQASAQISDLNIWFGPDTYMGRNLSEMVEVYSGLSNEEIARLHPAHSRATLQSLHERLHYFEQGVCVVHHMFGEEVSQQVQDHYADAMLTAHLEVPGEMFSLALAAQREGRGVVGSTSNILQFITERVREVETGPLRFVLGTEAGMITSIVGRVQAELRARSVSGASPHRAVEIVFPVASEAIAEASDSELGVVPGVQAGEGCSTAGGCATCPFMKMNSLDALLNLARAYSPASASEGRGKSLRANEARRLSETGVDDARMTELGTQPVLHMRAFQQSGRLSDALVADVQNRHASSVLPPAGAAE